MNSQSVVIMIMGMSLVTWMPRVIPVGLLAGRAFHPWVVRWLKYVPVSILSAMLISQVFIRQGRIVIGAENPDLLPAIVATFTAWKTRNLFMTVLIGMVALALLRLWD